MALYDPQELQEQIEEPEDMDDQYASTISPVKGIDLQVCI